MPHLIKTIISGGQTGVDQGALYAALTLKIPIKGYCPKGRLAENGTIPAIFTLIETESKDYHIRTEKNVIESDGTLIINPSKKLQGGTKLTHIFTKKHKKPVHIHVFDHDPIDDILNWIKQYNIQHLNIAGPRESKNKGIQKKTQELVEQIFI